MAGRAPSPPAHPPCIPRALLLSARLPHTQPCVSAWAPPCWPACLAPARCSTAFVAAGDISLQMMLAPTGARGAGLLSPSVQHPAACLCTHLICRAAAPCPSLHPPPDDAQLRGKVSAIRPYAAGRLNARLVPTLQPVVGSTVVAAKAELAIHQMDAGAGRTAPLALLLPLPAKASLPLPCHLLAPAHP